MPMWVPRTQSQDHGLELALDMKLFELAKLALEKGEAVDIELPILNTDRTVGTILSNELAKAQRRELLPEDTVKIKFNGSAGQSPVRVSIGAGESEGDANDYVGKGLSGGKLTIYRPSFHLCAGRKHPRWQCLPIRRYWRQGVLPRSCGGAVLRSEQRLSEGVGDPAGEYMTGGRAVILNAARRNRSRHERRRGVH